MSDGDVQVSAARRKRVQRLKKYIVGMLVGGIMTPLVLCIVLWIQVRHLGQVLERLTGEVQELSDQVRVQQERMDEFAAAWAVTGQGNPVSSESNRELSGHASEPLTGELTLPEEPEPEPEETPAHRVYLTFDDGPSTYTDDILDILDTYDVKATFFVLGKETDSAREAMKDIVDRGHTLGMHSYSHKYTEIYESVESFAEDFTKLRDYLYEVTGVKSSVYRFPGGSSNTVSSLDMREFAEYLDEQEVRFFDWNISSGDGSSRLLSVEDLVKNCTAGIEKRGTSVILLHDSANKSTTVEALPIIIENILAMEDTVILPITDETEPVQHIH
ncbi:MAG: polysaccharide deacetylase [Acetatifactor sp.]|nr:polysaccharide deacetylase [Acetatifactor sp.]